MENSVEVIKIDEDIENLANVDLNVDITGLNLYCNRIKKIENIDHLCALRHLNLSSNCIKEMTGLHALVSLQTLNLASNEIQVVSGLGTLRKLKVLNLSFNQIHDLQGFKDVRGSTHSLEHVELYGNKLTKLEEATRCLMNSSTLKKLYFSLNNDSNPICSTPAYRAHVLSQLPHLEVLDGKDRYGHDKERVCLYQAVPGLQECMQLLQNPSSSDQSFSSVSDALPELIVNIPTPKIDGLLDKFKKRIPSKRSDAFPPQKDSDGSNPVPRSAPATDSRVNERLESLEDKLLRLVSLYEEQQAIEFERHRLHHQSCSSSGDEVVSAVIDEPTSSNPKDFGGLSVTKSGRKSYTKEDISRGGDTNAGKLLAKNPSISGLKLQRKSKGDRRKKVQKNTSTTSSEPPSMVDRGRKTVRDPQDDESYLALIQEMDAERERRWKAEQAARKLVEQVKDLQDKVVEERKIQEATLSASARLKHVLTSEKETRQKFEKLAENLQVEVGSLKKEIDVLKDSETQNEQIIKSLREALSKVEKDKLEENSQLLASCKTLELDAAGTRRELELLRSTVSQKHAQLLQLQDLLINREQEHKSRVEKMVALDSSEVRDLIEREKTKTEARCDEAIRHHLARLSERNREYESLEDEFRLALQIEANRFNELHASHQQVCAEMSELKSSYEGLSQKEAKSRHLVAELSAMVKEQRARMSEIAKGKTEAAGHLKDRVQALEAELSVMRKEASRIPSLTQEKEQLLAQVRGQESVIQGLRSERKLWGQELAEQGASLAQDRGRLEAQIEGLKSEISSLNNRMQEMQDTLKIKSKLIEDQTDTIRKLKAELSNASVENQKLADAMAKAEEDYLKDVDALRESNSELQESVDSLTTRKEELKAKLADANREVDRSKEDLRNLKQKWDDRSDMLGQLEEKVVKMKETFDGKEARLAEERDVALKRASELEKRLASCEESYRRELATKLSDFELNLRKAAAEKDDLVQQAHERVTCVEEEMRILLLEKAKQKKSFEARLKQMSQAFLDMQKDLT